MENKITWVCSNCGSKDVEVKAWVDANSLAVRDVMDHDNQDTFCNVCNDHHGVESEDDYNHTEPQDPETKVFNAMQGGTDGG